jgi:hydrogenase maturation protease
MDAGGVVSTGAVLVAGVGNMFLGDDGFGVEVVRQLRAKPLPPGVSVQDFGIRAIHLAYELLETAWDLTILVDALPRGGAAGTVYLVEPDLAARLESGSGPAVEPAAGFALDGHSMRPETVFAWLSRLGVRPKRLLIVGCEPARLDEEMGLSEPVAAAVGEATEMILDLVAGRRGGMANVPRDSGQDCRVR